MPEDGPDLGDFDAPSPPRPFRRSLKLAAWVVAVVVFEMTADPSLVVIVACSKFGWKQLGAAFWLGRVDPNRRRGRACRWLYVSWGLWRISLTATLFMFAIVFAVESLPKPIFRPANVAAGPPPAFISAALLAFIGFIVSSLVAFLGLFSAWRGRVLVWVGPEAITAWESRQWPPRGPARGKNVAVLLVLTAVPFFYVFFVCPWLMLGLSRMALLMPNQAAQSNFVAISTLVVMVGGAVAMLALAEPIRTRTVAFYPAACWPPHEATAPPPSIQSMFGSA